MLPSAHAQLGPVYVAETVAPGEIVNAFTSWEGRDGIQGVVVDVPPGWSVIEARVLRRGFEPIPVQLRPEGTRVHVTASHVLEGPHHIALRLRPSDYAGEAAWSITPFSRSTSGTLTLHTGERARLRTRMEPPAAPTDNYVLDFADAGAPVRLRPDALPPIGMGRPYTLEFWMRTTGLDEVILSAWTGEEHAAYPVELMTGAGGRLLFYRGQPGRHESMVSRRPVADGRWHHVALTNDPATGYTRLFLDGTPADSLYAPAAPAVDAGRLALGGRPARTSAPDTLRFTGQLDEVRVWATARPPMVIRQTLHQPLRPGAGGVAVLGFERPIPDRLLAEARVSAERRASAFALARPVRDLRASVEADAVRLSWQTDDRETVRFVVERSEDGTWFEPVGEVAAGGGPRYEFQDPLPKSQVLFYRVRQALSYGEERTSAVLKLGLGEETPQAHLLEPYPNPFNPLTTLSYVLRETQHVQLRVYNFLGHEVAQLVDAVQEPGHYQIPFAAAELPSGRYLVRLRTEQAEQSRTIVLAK